MKKKLAKYIIGYVKKLDRGLIKARDGSSARVSSSRNPFRV